MKEKRFHILVVSTLFAVLLWVSVNMMYEYQTSVFVPLVLENMKTSRALVRPVPSSLMVKVRGTGWQIMGLHFFPDARYVLDVGETNTRQVFIVGNDVMDRLRIPRGLRAIDFKPDTITVVLDEKIRKTVPVVSILDVSFREGYDIAGKITIIPESVIVSGGRSLAEQIKVWKTKPIELTDLKSRVDARVELSDSLSYGIALTPRIVSVAFDVQPTAEKLFKGIPVTVNQVPERMLVVLIPPKIDIIVRGSVNRIAEVGQKDFTAFVDYKSILLDTTGTILPSVEEPPGTRVVSQQPQRLQYVIRK